MEGGDMIKNQDAGDIRGWKRSFDLRSSGARRELLRSGPQGSAFPSDTATAFSAPGSAADQCRLHGRRRRVASRARRRWISGRGSRPGAGPSAWRRHSNRYWTIASVSALVALVAAGITAGAGQHQRSHVAAQGRHGRSRPGGGLNTSGAASMGLAAPGGLLADAAGSASPSAVAGTNGGGGPRFGQRARWTRHPDWGGDLHRRSGLASGAVGRRSERGWRGCGFAAACGHQSGRSRRVDRREHGELLDVVDHDARERNRELRPGCGLDHRCREQGHHHHRSGGERVGAHDNGKLPFGCKQIATAHSSEDGLRADAQQLITATIGASNNAPTTAKNGA